MTATNMVSERRYGAEFAVNLAISEKHAVSFSRIQVHSLLWPSRYTLWPSWFVHGRHGIGPSGRNKLQTV